MNLWHLLFVNNCVNCHLWTIDGDWMPIFEKSTEKSWDEKIYTRDETFNGKTIHVIGL